MTKKILLTGFEPFGGNDINSSQVISDTLDGAKINQATIFGREVKLEFATIRRQIRALVDELDPHYVVLTGQANRHSISLEKTALNYVDSRGHPYNCGTVIEGQVLEENAPVAYFSNIDLHELERRIREKGVPIRISYFAGTFGCNQLYFETAHYLQVLNKASSIPFVFVHVPLLPKQALTGTKPSMSLDLMLKGIRSAIFEITKPPQTF